MRIVIDPGHGGHADAGRSSANGVRGPRGTLERDVTLAIARAIASRLGGRTDLTRADDRNLTLAARAARARAAGPALFLSIHTNAGPPDRRGAEIWVHDRAGPPSHALADAVAATLGGVVHRGPLAVLAPEQHAAGGAACLIEVDYLSHPEVERVLSGAAGQHAAADAIVRALVGLHDRGARFGQQVAPVWVDKDANGMLWGARYGMDFEVGVTDAAGTSYVGVFQRQPFASLALATAGYIATGTRPHGHALVVVEEVTLSASTQGTAAAGFTRFDAAPTGRRTVRRWHDGGAAMTWVGGARGGWRPIAPDAMDAVITPEFDERSIVKLYDGSLWVWMKFRYRDERNETARWVPPGHPMADVEAAMRDIDPEIARLPAGNVRAQIEAYRNILLAVATHEGSFGSRSPAWDTMASLGIFQWGMVKNQSASSGSLGVFFRRLRDRANAVNAAAPTPEDTLYTDAWRQVTNAGLSIHGQELHVDGAVATGATVEARMAPHMNRADLRTYQLVGALDWIEEFRQQVIRPGPSVGRELVGNDYTETGGGGTSCTLEHGRTTFALDAPRFRMVGQLLTSVRALTNAVTLGVNRPHYVEAAAWKVLNPTIAAADVRDAMANIKTEMSNAGAAIPRRITRAVVEASLSGPALLHLENLEAMIWPMTLPADPEWRVVGDFRRHGLFFYSDPDEARRLHREGRFSTLELLTW